ncbi:MAG: hypothetical protein ABSE05_09055 [Syntrophales bacterium]|jgi:hypothetical protein
MEHRFNIIKRVFENDALIVFIDLLGTRKFYETGLAEQQAQKILRSLLSQFAISFSKHFKKDEIEQSFDVSIFADSIVASPRKSISNIVERLVDFSLSYQAALHLKKVYSRATIVKDTFFSFKMTDPSPKSILGSRYTSISLCGGKGIKLAHDSLEGLPIGVYVTEGIKNDLSAEQKKRAIPVKDESLLFIKQKWNIVNFLPAEAVDLLTKNPNAQRKTIRHSLKASHPDEEALEKLSQWVYVHLGRQNKIIRYKKPSRGMWRYCRHDP